MQPCRFHGMLLGAILLLGCLPPVLPPDPQPLRNGLLAFLVEGRTTREDVLVHLGTPTAEFEGRRIFTYDFVWDPKGEWRRVGGTVVSEWRFNYRPGTCSLVLVFSPEGVVARHNLVIDRVEPVPMPPQPPAGETPPKPDSP